MTSRTLTVSSAPRARREPWVAHGGCALSRSLDVLITGNSPRQHRPRARSRGANAHRSYGAQWTPAPRRRCRRSGASAPVRCPRTISPPACTSALSQAGAARAAGHRRDRSPAQLQETRRAHRQETQIARLPSNGRSVLGSVEVCSNEHVAGQADGERNECHADQQPCETSRPAGAGPRRWRSLIRFNFAQDVSRDGDVGRGDEHVTRTAGKELRHGKTRRAADDGAHVRVV
jgi:hypothetical protein